jgi:hypothetical protein
MGSFSGLWLAGGFDEACVEGFDEASAGIVDEACAGGFDEACAGAPDLAGGFDEACAGDAGGSDEAWPADKTFRESKSFKLDITASGMSRGNRSTAAVFKANEKISVSQWGL